MGRALRGKRKDGKSPILAWTLVWYMTWDSGLRPDATERQSLASWRGKYAQSWPWASTAGWSQRHLDRTCSFTTEAPGASSPAGAAQPKESSLYQESDVLPVWQIWLAFFFLPLLMSADKLGVTPVPFCNNLTKINTAFCTLQGIFVIESSPQPWVVY